MNIKAFIKKGKKEYVNVCFRLRDTDIDLHYKSDIIISTKDWDDKNQSIKKPSGNILDEQKKRRISLTDKIDNRLKLIRDIFVEQKNPKELTSSLLVEAIDKKINPEKYEEKQQTFFDTFDEFLEKHPLSSVRKKNFRVIKRALQRFELYKNLTSPFILTFENLTLDILNELEYFLFNEYQFCEEYPAIYKAVPESRTPTARGQNTINDIFTKIRTFIIWANTPDPTTKTAKTTNNAFGKNGYKIKECTYGTPYYISIEERNKLFNFKFTDEKLSIQRDIFVFQSLIGCRVGDLYNMTKANIIDNNIEYVARKTKEKKKITVRVPLLNTAMEILAKYPDCEMILPFISEQHYNKAIKEIFLQAGITRTVTWINPSTGIAEQRPINEIASSHLARRTFIGNLYKQVKDPNLVGILSGHKEGSKAFSRYREISDDIKIDTMKLLE